MEPSLPAENGSAEVSDQDREHAEQAKARGNDAFAAKHYPAAVVAYTEAIQFNPSVAAYYSNRAFAHVRLENYGSAVADASKALELDSRFTKAFYRRGDANFLLGKYKLAARDFRQAAKMAPNDPDLRRKLAEAEKEVKRIRFEEALSLPEAEIVPVSESIDLSSMPVADSYSGPRMAGSEKEGYRISQEFVTAMVEEFRQQRKIHLRFAFQIVMDILAQLQTLPTSVDITIPEGASFTVCGDVHGQFYDLMNIFELNGLPSEENPYLFNGDFVDRGSFSMEVILTLFALKCLYPQHVHLARGNHESKSMNSIYGFNGEVKQKYSAQLVELFAETFRQLPLAHVLNSKVLVVHGGLFSQDGVKLDDIRAIDRNREPPEEGLMCELLWSDPQAEPGRSPSKRGVGVGFGPDVTKRFLEDNGLELIVRSHEVKDEGYEVEHDGFLVTIFSAPNYCDQMGNKGAFIKFTAPDMTPHFTTFAASPHPDVKPMAYAAGMFGRLLGM